VNAILPGPQRDEAILVRAFARRCLAACGDIDPASLAFESGPFGKPRVRAPQHARALRFNLAKTDGLVVCAVSRDHDVGIDVEHLGRRVRALDISRRHFAPQEAAALAALRNPEQPFYALWVLKEAYAKALGMGLTLPLDRCTFEVGPQGQVGAERTNVTDWRFRLWAPTPDHVMALAVPLT